MFPPLPPMPEFQAQPAQKSPLDLIAPFLAIGTALSGNQPAATGAFEGLAQNELQRQKHEQGQQELALKNRQLGLESQAQQVRLQQFEADAAQRRQLEEDKRRSVLIAEADKLRGLKFDSAKEYDDYVTSMDQGLAMYGIPPNRLRALAPFRAKSAAVVAGETLDKLEKTYGPDLYTMTGKVQADLNKDGSLDSVDVAELLRLAGRGVMTGKDGKPMPSPKGADAKALQVYYDAELAQWAAQKGRPPESMTPQEEAAAMARAEKRHKEATSTPAPAVNINMPGMTPQDRVESAAQDLIAHRMAPSQLATFFTGMGANSASQLRSLVMQRVKQLQPEFNFAEAESGYAFGKATGTQTTVRMIDNIQKSLPVLERIASKAALGNIRTINRGVLAAKREFGEADAAAYDTARLGLADEIAKILSGGGTGSTTSDAKLRQANELLNQNMSPAQLTATLSTVKELLATRRDSLTGGTFMEKPQEDRPAPITAASVVGDYVTLPDGRIAVITEKTRTGFKYDVVK